MLARLNLVRTDYLRQAGGWLTLLSQRRYNCVAGWEEMSSVTYRMTNQTHQSITSAERQDTLKRRVLIQKRIFKSGDTDFVLAVQGTKTEINLVLFFDYLRRSMVVRQWIKSPSFQRCCLLRYAEVCVSEWSTAERGALRIMKCGTVLNSITGMGKAAKVRLLDVYYAENLERNIISYGLLEAKGYGTSE